MWIWIAAALAAPPLPADADAETRFAWAVETVPALASYREAPAAADFGGWGHRVVLYAWDLGEPSPQCERFVLRNSGDALATRDGRTRLGASLVHASEVLGALGAIEADVVRYDAVPVRARIVCTEITQVTRCLDGTEQACDACEGFRAQLISLSPRHGFGYGAGAGFSSSPHPEACTGCPPDPPRDLLEPLNDAVGDHTFWTRVDAAPAFFRDPEACEADRVHWAEVLAPAR